MKRKILLFFLTIISAVCICAGFSACDLLNELTAGNQDTEQTQSGNDSEQDTSGDDGSGQTPSEDNGSGQDTSGDEGSEQTPSEDDGSEQTPSEEENQEQTPSDNDGSGSEEDEEIVVEFTLSDGNSTYGYNQFADETNGAGMQSMYEQMYTACETFSTDTSDVTATSGYYIISEISYGGYSLTTDEALSVWEIFYLENPIYYWLSGSCAYTSSTLYLCIDETYASYADRETYDAAILAMFTEANTKIAKQSTELEKALAIHDYIIGKIDYAYQSDNTPETAIWAHNITGVSSMGAGVCEAYSKTFLALCLMNGLDCIIVTGYSSSSSAAHAWNLVKIDGVWYGVDCTWDDTGDNDDLSYVYFGMNADAISSTRVTYTSTYYGLNYLYELPEVAERGIQLVTLFKDGTELGMYVNADAAFDAMTDPDADYTIEFYFTNPAGTLVCTSPATIVYIYSSSTPAVNSITINGVYTSSGSGFYVSYLTMQSKLTLCCNLEISNIILTAELDLGEYTLTAGGYYCRLNGTVYDNKTTDAISIKSATTGRTDIYAELNVSYYYGNSSISGTAVIGTYYGSDMLNVYGTVTIDKYISANDTQHYNVYLQEGSALSVNNLVYDSNDSTKIIHIIIYFSSTEKYPSLYLGNVEAQTYLYISGYISGTEAAEPANLGCAIATLGDAAGFEKIKIYFGSDDKTSLYSVNTDKQIVYN